MQLIDILKYESFVGSQILAGQSALTNEVESVMILEASDIENWGSKNQLILSSYFALEDLNEDELEQFYLKMKSIGISGLIIKPKRLIEEVPDILINLSNKYIIPLILINYKVTYETIVMSVLQPIINENTSILNAYYDYRQHFNNLSLLDLTLEEILEQLKSILHTEIQLEVLGSNFVVTTFNHPISYKEEAIEIVEKSHFKSHNYINRKLTFANYQTQNILSVFIPNIDNKPYLFSIFKDPKSIGRHEFMLIENAVEYLKTYFLIDHSIKKDQFMHKNNQMIDLLFNPNLEYKEINHTLQNLNISENEYYQLIIFSIQSQHKNMKKLIDGIVTKMKSLRPFIAFLQKNEDVIFLVNLKEGNKLISNDFTSFFSKGNNIQVSISSLFKDNFYQEMQKLEKLRHFLTIVYSNSIAMEYENLGFYKLFLEIKKIEDLLQYIPEKIKSLVDTKPDLAETLEVFLDNSKNFVKTGELLYIHSKTVRYRIEKVTEMLDLDLDNANQLLTTHVALKVYHYAKQ